MEGGHLLNHECYTSKIGCVLILQKELRQISEDERGKEDCFTLYTEVFSEFTASVVSIRYSEPWHGVHVDIVALV